MSTSKKVAIVPHYDPMARGTDMFSLVDVKDILGNDASRIIIARPDIGYYLTTHLQPDVDGKEIPTKTTIYRIHPTLKGEHYFASTDNFVYVIKKGNLMSRVELSDEDFLAGKALSGLNNFTGFKLHQNCCGGDHYLSTAKDAGEDGLKPVFVVIFQKRGVYRMTSDLTTDIPFLQLS